MDKTKRRAIEIDENGIASWNSRDVLRYEVTGTDRHGKRFKIVTDNWIHASGINLWRGSKWLVRWDGRRERIQTVFN